eukprot:s4909_g6.t1
MDFDDVANLTAWAKGILRNRIAVRQGAFPDEELNRVVVDMMLWLTAVIHWSKACPRFEDASPTWCHVSLRRYSVSGLQRDRHLPDDGHPL